MSSATVIIAAHNEEAVIARTLTALTADASASDALRILVVCNGCVDRTADVARGFVGVEVLELEVASKAAALREGDRIADLGPRIYLDADVVMTRCAALATADALSTTAIAGRPPHVFDTSRATWVVRSWYRVRERVPSIANALWGAGCYALSEAGRARFDEFPEVVSDDLFIDSLFRRGEVHMVDTDPIIVTTPRRTRDLLRILRRSYRTQSEVIDAPTGLSEGQRGQLADIRGIVASDPRRIGDAVVYASVILYARLRARTSHGAQRWERDQSSREL